MWETMSIIAAVVVGAVALFLIFKRQAKRGVPSCCRDCPYGAKPSECEPPPDAPPQCPKLK